MLASSRVEAVRRTYGPTESSLGIVATCRAVSVPAQAFLSWVFDRLGTHRDAFALALENMTPAAFKKTLG